nr:trypsin-like serine protease [Amycolatopsis sp. CA-230715]
MRRTSSKVVAGAVAAAAIGIGVVAAQPAGAVANGVEVNDGIFPFAVKFLMTDIPKPDGSKYDSACSGALIDRQWVITAGHCFHDVNRKPVSGPVPYKTKAIIGRVDDADTDKGHERSVVEVHQSPKNDVSIAKLDQPVDDIKPIPLREEGPRKDETLVLAGWGQESPDATGPAKHLRLGIVKVHDVQDVVTNVTGYWPKPDTSACPTDSGAPYFEQQPNDSRLVSLESGGPTCPHTGPERTSRVDVIADWIREKIADAKTR